ncbi:MAG: hypothetical protein K0U74_11970 [Alphaproteobacteria bacterium]|nr:hypothetical protein [Alphaproteobacteria bacterium]
MNISEKLNAWLNEPLQQDPKHKRVKGVRVHDQMPTNVVRNGIRRVKRDTTPLVELRGWSKSSNTWKGHYATHVGTWPGQIEQRGDVFRVLIHNPPEQVRGHAKFGCFHKRKNGWWSIHLHTNPIDRDVSAVIGFVERILAESLNSKR